MLCRALIIFLVQKSKCLFIFLARLARSLEIQLRDRDGWIFKWAKPLLKLPLQHRHIDSGGVKRRSAARNPNPGPDATSGNAPETPYGCRSALLGFSRSRHRAVRQRSAIPSLAAQHRDI